MMQWKTYLGIALVFILGVLVGLLPGFYFTHRFPPPPPPFKMDRASMDKMVLDRLSKELTLTDAQKVKVGAAVKRMSEKLDKHMMTIQSEVRPIFDEGFSQIEKELTDSQRQRLHALRERMERRGPGGPPPPHGLFP